MGWHQLDQQPTVCGHDDNSVAILRRRQRKDDRQPTATRYGYGVFRRTERHAPLHVLPPFFVLRGKAKNNAIITFAHRDKQPRCER